MTVAERSGTHSTGRAPVVFLSYARADKAQAMYRLGVSEEVANVVDQLSPAQLMKIASANQLICRFRFDDDMVWNLLTSHSKSRATGTGAVAGLHANIVMAGQIADLS